MTDALITKQAALWIQPDGANSQKYFLGCHDLDDISAPRGGTELVRCFKPDGSGWKVVATKQAPPDPITTTITSLIYRQRDWIEQLNCPFNIYVLYTDCGRRDVFNNYIRGLVLQSARLTGHTYSQIVSREEELEGMVAADIEAEPPLLYVTDLTIERMVTTEAQALNDVWINTESRCTGDCGAALERGDYAYAVADSSGATTPDVLYSLDEGVTWAATATDPAFGNFNAMAGVRVQLDRTTFRLIVGREGLGGAVQGQMAYSDNNGTTWTTSNIGTAAAQHGPVYGEGMWAQATKVFVASSLGYIYKSEDYGETWVAVESGAITVQNLYAIHFADDLNGMAGGATGVVMKTVDGGESWQAVTVPAVQTVNTIQMLDSKRAWVGLANGTLYYTTDGGTTWTQRTGWTGSGVGQVRSISFLPDQDLIAFMAVNSAGPVGTVLRTIDGGHEWQTLTTPTNSGLNSIVAARDDLAYAVGEANAGTAVILKVRAQ